MEDRTCRSTCRNTASRSVGRGGVEPPTFHFSGGRSYQLSYLPERWETLQEQLAALECGGPEHEANGHLVRGEVPSVAGGDVRSPTR